MTSDQIRKLLVALNTLSEDVKNLPQATEDSDNPFFLYTFVKNKMDRLKKLPIKLMKVFYVVALSKQEKDTNLEALLKENGCVGVSTDQALQIYALVNGYYSKPYFFYRKERSNPPNSTWSVQEEKPLRDEFLPTLIDVLEILLTTQSLDPLLLDQVLQRIRPPNLEERKYFVDGLLLSAIVTLGDCLTNQLLETLLKDQEFTRCIATVNHEKIYQHLSAKHRNTQIKTAILRLFIERNASTDCLLYLWGKINAPQCNLMELHADFKYLFAFKNTTPDLLVQCANSERMKAILELIPFASHSMPDEQLSIPSTWSSNDLKNATQIIKALSCFTDGSVQTHWETICSKSSVELVQAVKRSSQLKDYQKSLGQFKVTYQESNGVNRDVRDSAKVFSDACDEAAVTYIVDNDRDKLSELRTGEAFSQLQPHRNNDIGRTLLTIACTVVFPIAAVLLLTGKATMSKDHYLWVDFSRSKAGTATQYQEDTNRVLSHVPTQ